MNYRLLVTDVDGTLLNSKHRISPENAAAVAQLRRRGYLFTLATGRTQSGVSSLAADLQLSEPLILCNGARVVDLKEGQILHQRNLGAQAAQQALTLLEGLALDVYVFSAGRLFARANASSQLQKSLEESGVPVQEVRSLQKFLEGELAGSVTQLLLLGAQKPLAEFRRSFNELELSGVDLVSTDPNFYLEVVPGGVDKGEALKTLCAFLGVSLREVVAVGDAPNDRGMLALAGMGVAVANAQGDLLEAADYVAPSCEESAIAHVIERFFG